jgi:coproporphyrinogen III oxidase-like Fe-S oxidoreductase
VTWYILRVHQESGWYRSYRRGDLELAPPEDSVRRRLLIREGMRRIGYAARPGGRFVANSSLHDRFKKVRAGTDPTLLGMGVSAYSHGWGYFFRNSYSTASRAGIRSYIERVQRDGLAVETGLRLSPSEVVAGHIVTGIRSGIPLPRADTLTESYLVQAEAALQRLRQSGLVEVDAVGTGSLTGLGYLFGGGVVLAVLQWAGQACTRGVR